MAYLVKGVMRLFNNNNPTAVSTDPRTLQPYSPEFYAQGMAKVAPLEHLKPSRRTGSNWINERAHTIDSVTLCDACITKYWGFWRVEGMRPSWNNYFTGECDGCSTRYSLVILFVPESRFESALAGMHGRFSSPRPKLFKWPWSKRAVLP